MEEIHDTGNGEGIFLNWGGTVSFWGTGAECRTVHKGCSSRSECNPVLPCHLQWEKKKATTQSSLDHFFKWVQFSSVTQSCPTLCDPMACSSPCFPVHHQLTELTQTHVKWVDRVESSKEPEPVPSTSGMSEITACPPLFADDPSALPSPTLSRSSS